MKQRQSTLEQLVFHMATHWIDRMNVGGAGDCAFYDL